MGAAAIRLAFAVTTSQLIVSEGDPLCTSANMAFVETSTTTSRWEPATSQGPSANFGFSLIPSPIRRTAARQSSIRTTRHQNAATSLSHLLFLGMALRFLLTPQALALLCLQCG